MTEKEKNKLKNWHVMSGHITVYDASKWKFFVDEREVNPIMKDLLFKVTSTSVLINLFIPESSLSPFFEGHEFKAVYEHLMVVAPIDSVNILPKIDVGDSEVPYITLHIDFRPRIEYVKEI